MIDNKVPQHYTVSSICYNHLQDALDLRNVRDVLTKALCFFPHHLFSRGGGGTPVQVVKSGLLPFSHLVNLENDEGLSSCPHPFDLFCSGRSWRVYDPSFSMGKQFPVF